MPVDFINSSHRTVAPEAVTSLSCFPGFCNPHSSSFLLQSLLPVSSLGCISVLHTNTYTANIQKLHGVSEAFQILHEYLIFPPPKNLSALPVFLPKQKPRTIIISSSLPLTQTNCKTYPFYPEIYFCLHSKLVAQITSNLASCLVFQLPLLPHFNPVTD